MSLTPRAAPLAPLRHDQAKKLSAWLAQGVADGPPRLTDQSTIADLRAQGVTASMLRACAVPPIVLARSGASLKDLRALGFDALDLAAQPALAGQLVAFFGKAPTAVAFLQTAADAVSIAASDAARILGLTPRQLLQACAGAPIAATACLDQLAARHGAEAREAEQRQQLPPSHFLSGLSTLDLTSAGIDAEALERIGVPPEALPALLGVDDHAQLASLGLLVA